MSSIFKKLLKPRALGHEFLVKMHNYYHPMTREGSATPLWHFMIAVSAVMYTFNYVARDGKEIQERRQLEKKVLKDYYDAHGGAPHH